MQESLRNIKAKKEAFECLKKMYEISHYAGFSKEVRGYLMSALIVAENEVEALMPKMPATIYINPSQYDDFAKAVLGSKPVQANQI